MLMRQPPGLFSVLLTLLGAIDSVEAYLDGPAFPPHHPQRVSVHDSHHMGGEGFGGMACGAARREALPAQVQPTPLH